ncbi:uncharacterized protein LOC125683783 [Ostrea edulis]|uniref:uncharacterized protein LOC125683783 n=1 Tax=Ostrea edulis TaxID=37623 RepID=UPI0024AFD355|nr:uncharacterized protein LOC125683783 [Ostrea edulis]
MRISDVKIRTMLLWIVFTCLSFLCITESNILSPLTDGEIQNVTSLAGVDLDNRNIDVFRQLLNQETLIRIALVKNVHSLMKDMVDLKQNMGTTTRQLRNAEKEIAHLKQDVISLKTENQNLKGKVLKFQQGLEVIDRNFTQAAKSRIEYEKELDTKMLVYEKNTSKILDDIKVEVRYLSLTLLDLKEHNSAVEKSIPKLVENKFTLLSERMNDSLVWMKGSLLSSNKNHKQLSKNLSDVENYQSSIMNILSDDINKTMYGIKAEVEQSKNDQLKLSSAVSSLEVFRLNMSLNSCGGKAAPVGFTVGVTSSSSSWTGSTLVFPHVVYNGGNGYNPSTGIFTSPTDGTYVFFVKVNVYGSNYLYLDIVLNGNSKVRSMSHNSAQYMTGTNLAVLRLNKGDRVWVKRYSGTGYYSDSVPITTFSGFLLW